MPFYYFHLKLPHECGIYSPMTHSLPISRKLGSKMNVCIKSIHVKRFTEYARFLPLFLWFLVMNSVFYKFCFFAHSQSFFLLAMNLLFHLTDDYWTRVEKISQTMWTLKKKKVPYTITREQHYVNYCILSSHGEAFSTVDSLNKMSCHLVLLLKGRWDGLVIEIQR